MPKSNRNTARAIRRMRSATASCLEFMAASLKKSVLLCGGEDEDVSPVVDIYLQVAAVALGVGEPAGLVLAFGDFRRFLAALTIEPGQQHGVFRVLLRRRFRQRLRRPEIKLHPAHLQTDLAHTGAGPPFFVTLLAAKMVNVVHALQAAGHRSRNLLEADFAGDRPFFRHIGCGHGTTPRFTYHASNAFISPGIAGFCTFTRDRAAGRSPPRPRTSPPSHNPARNRGARRGNTPPWRSCARAPRRRPDGAAGRRRCAARPWWWSASPVSTPESSLCQWCCVESWSSLLYENDMDNPGDARAHDRAQVKVASMSCPIPGVRIRKAIRYGPGPSMLK